MNWLWPGLIVAAGFAFVLCSCLLAALREIMILRGHVVALHQLVVTPPNPPYIGKSPPETLRRALSTLREATEKVPIRMVVFLSGGCSSCRELLDGLEEARAAGALDARETALILDGVAQEGSARRVTRNVLIDTDQDLFRSCEVFSGPAVLFLENDGRVASAFERGVGLASVLARSSVEQERVPAVVGGSM